MVIFGMCWCRAIYMGCSLFIVVFRFERRIDEKVDKEYTLLGKFKISNSWFKVLSEMRVASCLLLLCNCLHGS